MHLPAEPASRDCEDLMEGMTNSKTLADVAGITPGAGEIDLELPERSCLARPAILEWRTSATTTSTADSDSRATDA